jgi:hypothetical protein
MKCVKSFLMKIMIMCADLYNEDDDDLFVHMSRQLMMMMMVICVWRYLMKMISVEVPYDEDGDMPS